MDDFIPVNEPLLDGNERRYLQECIDTGWISSEGPFVDRFERAFAARVDRRHAVAVSNGTAALEAAVVALGLGEGDEILLPSFTIISCALAVIRAGAVPVLVDSDPQTWNVDTELLAERVTERTRAIMVVHTYGLPVDMDPVLELAERHQLKIIEDAAEAHGQSYRGRPCGSFGDISTFSFYANKHVSCGEGGMLVTDDDELAGQCRRLRNLGFEEKRFVHRSLGWNLRMTNLQAAVGVAQLERLDEFIARKRVMGRRYTEGLRDLSSIQLPLAQTPYAENDYWVYGLLSRAEAIEAEALAGRLRECGIGTRPFFWPMHEQPVWRERGLFAGERYPVAESLARRGLYLPSGLGLSDAQLERVVTAVKSVVA